MPQNITAYEPTKPDPLHFYIARGRLYLGDVGVAWHMAVHDGDYEEADSLARRYHLARKGWSMGAGRNL